MCPYFGHEKLIVYQTSLEYMALVFSIVKRLSGDLRHAKDQLLRAAQSIPLNIAEGNGKSSLPDKRRFLEIARGSAMECAAIQDVLKIGEGISPEHEEKGKQLLIGIVSMLTKLSRQCQIVQEQVSSYGMNDSDLMAGIELEKENGKVNDPQFEFFTGQGE